MGGGEPLFEVLLGGAPGGAFLAELGGEDLNDASCGIVGAGPGGPGRDLGGLLGAQRFDAAGAGRGWRRGSRG